MDINKNKKEIFKLAAFILLLAMLVRHSMFYFSHGNIITEMGYNQDWYGVLLVPVTASFGIFFFWGREKISLSRYNLIRLILIASLPLFIALHRVQFDVVNAFHDVFSYDIYDSSRRPSFLILVPIVFSIFVCSLNLSRIVLVLIVFALQFVVGPTFVSHYFSIFMLFYLLQSFELLKYKSNFIISVMLFIVTALMVKTYEVVRIPLWMELFYAIGFIGVIMAVSKVALPFIIKINNNFLKLLSK